jgi:hypothetical protein
MNDRSNLRYTACRDSTVNNRNQLVFASVIPTSEMASDLQFAFDGIYDSGAGFIANSFVDRNNVSINYPPLQAPQYGPTMADASIGGVGYCVPSDIFINSYPTNIETDYFGIELADVTHASTSSCYETETSGAYDRSIYVKKDSTGYD